MSCRSVFRCLVPLAGVRLALVAGGVGILCAGSVPGTALAQEMQICSGYGAGFMRMPNSDSCVRVNSGVQAQGFTGGSLSNNANPGSGMSISEGASSSSLASSTMSAAPTSASPLSSLSSSTAANAGQAAVDPWKQAR